MGKYLSVEKLQQHDKFKSIIEGSDQGSEILSIIMENSEEIESNPNWQKEKEELIAAQKKQIHDLFFNATQTKIEQQNEPAAKPDIEEKASAIDKIYKKHGT